MTTREKLKRELAYLKVLLKELDEELAFDRKHGIVRESEYKTLMRRDSIVTEMEEIENILEQLEE